MRRLAGHDPHHRGCRQPADSNRGESRSGGKRGGRDRRGNDDQVAATGSALTGVEMVISWAAMASSKAPRHPGQLADAAGAFAPRELPADALLTLIESLQSTSPDLRLRRPGFPAHLQVILDPDVTTAKSQRLSRITQSSGGAAHGDQRA